MKTYTPKIKDIERKWHLIDADGQTLGRLCSQVSRLLIGKHKAMFTPNTDTGDFVVVINAAKIRVTGKKTTDKKYYRFSGYPGGMRATSLEVMLEKHPERIIEHAVKGMLPHTRLGRAMYKKLKVYAGDEHPHQAQLAVKKNIKDAKKGSAGK
ncbi:MAG: 50S ribosomal protein L13 [Dehalococcoidia bacterium]|nr:50S ribosomal protein L13 [Dehalococcoidia bacterium]MDD5494204.1 50S ribosomal protein L13 [Dehalococcoidia bacterium]